jgi:hypothetical protein
MTHRRSSRRDRRGLAIVAMALCLSNCRATSEAQPPAAQSAPGPPQAIRAVLRLHDVPLTVHESCRNVGPRFGDDTIGDYVACLIAEQTRTSPGGRNAVSASCQPSEPVGVYRCSVELAKQDGDDEWARGLEFTMAGGKVDNGSIRCTGGG